MNDMPEVSGLAPGLAEALASGTLADPFAVLGPHVSALGREIRVFLPGALEVEVYSRAGGEPLGQLAPATPQGLFSGRVSEVFFDEGQAVEKNQQIAILEQEEFKARRDQAQSDLIRFQ